MEIQSYLFLSVFIFIYLFLPESRFRFGPWEQIPSAELPGGRSRKKWLYSMWKERDSGRDRESFAAPWELAGLVGLEEEEEGRLRKTLSVIRLRFDRGNLRVAKDIILRLISFYADTHLRHTKVVLIARGEKILLNSSSPRNILYWKQY